MAPRSTVTSLFGVARAATEPRPRDFLTLATDMPCVAGVVDGATYASARDITAEIFGHEEVLRRSPCCPPPEERCPQERLSSGP